MRQMHSESAREQRIVQYEKNIMWEKKGYGELCECES